MWTSTSNKLTLVGCAYTYTRNSLVNVSETVDSLIGSAVTREFRPSTPNITFYQHFPLKGLSQSRIQNERSPSLSLFTFLHCYFCLTIKSDHFSIIQYPVVANKACLMFLVMFSYSKHLSVLSVKTCLLFLNENQDLPQILTMQYKNTSYN